MEASSLSHSPKNVITLPYTMHLMFQQIETDKFQPAISLYILDTHVDVTFIKEPPSPNQCWIQLLTTIKTSVIKKAQTMIFCLIHTWRLSN